MNILIFFLILVILVLVHEFGHFFSAKKFGIRVDEFGFGFPPKLFGVKKGETEYTFNLLPLGGFVKIFGENPDDESTSGPDASRSFINKPKWQQAIVLFSGVFANFLLAWFLFSFGFMSGLPTSVGSEPKGYELKDVSVMIISVLPDSPAFNAGLKSGDKIVSMKNLSSSKENSDNFTSDISLETVQSIIASGLNEEIEIGYIRGKNSDNLNFATVKPVSSVSGMDPKIGIGMDKIGIAKLPVWLALKEGMSLTLFITKATVFGLFGLILDGIRGQGSLDAITGPVGLIGIVGDAYQFGFAYLLFFTALISVNLAIINLIPFPALDGGRLLFLFIEKIKGSPINQKIFNIANLIGFGILMLLMILVTYQDILRLF